MNKEYLFFGITSEERMLVWKEMAKSQGKEFTWEAFKRMLHSDTMCGSQTRSTAKTILKKIRKSS
jgi:hypothetical protein